MHKLTDNKYLPELADGYHWQIAHTSDGSVRLTIFFRGPIGVSEQSTETVSILGLYPDAIRDKVLEQAKKMVAWTHPWHADGGPAIQRVIRGLHPPQDDASTEHEREVEGIIAEARRKAYNL